MRRPCLILALALWPVLALADGTPPRQGGVAVYRGSTDSVAPPIPIFRGSSTAGRPAPAASAPPPVAPTLAVGGGRLWLIDPEAGDLTACRLGGSTQLGQDRVRCTRRELP